MVILAIITSFYWFSKYASHPW